MVSESYERLLLDSGTLTARLERLGVAETVKAIQCTLAGLKSLTQQMSALRQPLGLPR